VTSGVEAMLLKRLRARDFRNAPVLTPEDRKLAAEGDPAEPKSELKYLRLILDVKEQQPELFQRILALPRKARSSRAYSVPIPVVEIPLLGKEGWRRAPGWFDRGDSTTQTGTPYVPNSSPLPLEPPYPNLPSPGGSESDVAVLTYFRQGRLDKFFRAHGNQDRADELDFFTTAEILETTAQESRQDIPPEQFYPLLDKNKSGFLSATTPGVDTLLSATATSGVEAMLLKRLRARDFRNAPALTPEDRKLAAEVHRLIAEGRVGKHTLTKLKKAFDQTADPVAMVAILRQQVARQYLLGSIPKTNASAPPAPREVILSSYLVEPHRHG